MVILLFVYLELVSREFVGSGEDSFLPKYRWKPALSKNIK